MELLFKLLLASQISTAPAPMPPQTELASKPARAQAYFKGIVIEERTPALAPQLVLPSDKFILASN